MKHYVGISLVLVTLAAIIFVAVRSCTYAVDHTVDQVRDAFVQVLRVQPQVTVNQRVIMTQTAPIAEFAVVSKEELVTLGFTEHLEIWSMQIPLTEKKVTVEAPFRLKAGFNLQEPFTVEINPTTHQVHASMPHAKILSVEQIGDLVYHAEDATLNRITDEERAKIINDLHSTASDSAEKSSLKSDAEQQVTQRLKDLIEHNGQPVQIEWTGTASPPSKPSGPIIP